MVRNYFSTEIVAEQYARRRPPFHRHVIAKLRKHLQRSLPFDRALDIGCGPGRSTQALEELASWSVGIDSSLPMLRHAECRGPTYYICGQGESLPVKDNTFDLLTASSAFHWFDRKLFLSEADRVLRPSGVLAVYDNYFSGNAVETDELRHWVFEVYRSRYPAPARGSIEFGPDTVNERFRVVLHDEYENPVRFSQDELVGYLLTQSNMIAALEDGRESPDEAARWLGRELGGFFTNGALTILFGGPIWILKPREVPS